MTTIPDFWMTRTEVGAICPSCADRMASLKIREIKASVFFGADNVRLASLKTAEKWQGLPKGWTNASLKKFWESLTGDAKHKVTKCIKQMTGKVDDPGAFCASARDRIEGTTGWRGERSAKISDPTELASELQRIKAAASQQGASRQVLASELRTLADRVLKA